MTMRRSALVGRRVFSGLERKCTNIQYAAHVIQSYCTFITKGLSMFHCLAWTEDIATAVENDLAPVSDDIFAINNNHFFPQKPYDLVFAAAMGTNLQRARFLAPSLRQVTNPFIRPIINALVSEDDPGVLDLRINPLRIRELEELEIRATQNAGVNQRITAIAGLSDQRIVAPPQGDIYKLRFVSITAAVANSWTSIVSTFDDNLPQGRFAVVGLEVVGAAGQASRLIFEDQTMRPGSLMSPLISDRTHGMFVNGGLGVWGYFTQNRMPIVQVLCNAATASFEGYLDIIRTA